MTYSRFYRDSWRYWKEVFHDGSGIVYFRRAGRAEREGGVMISSGEGTYIRLRYRATVLHDSVFKPITKDQFDVLWKLSELHDL